MEHFGFSFVGHKVALFSNLSFVELKTLCKKPWGSAIILSSAPSHCVSLTSPITHTAVHRLVAHYLCHIDLSVKLCLL